MASIFQGRLLAKPTVASLFRMEEVVAIKIVDSKCKTHFVLAWVAQRFQRWVLIKNEK
jgi:hypothetical protein